MRAQFVLITFVALTGCKKPPEAAPKVGWIQEEGWPGACYFPPAWEALGPGDRKLARQKALEGMVEQWSGSRGDGVSFSEETVTHTETVLLGRPEEIEAVSAKNAEQCRNFMTSGDSGAWSSWLGGVAPALTVGECNNPLVDTYFNYLDIGTGWQNRIKVCKGDRVQVTGAEIDYYRLVDNGPWINAAGDPAQSTSGSSKHECNIEGCLAGMLIVKFTGESGMTDVKPIGTQAVFTAPEHGAIQVQINDDGTWYDNKYKIENRLEHHMSVTYEPAK